MINIAEQDIKIEKLVADTDNNKENNSIKNAE